jgi:hypothetical protein
MHALTGVRATRDRRIGGAVALAIAVGALVALLAVPSGSARARPTCFGKPATIVGTNHRDVITKKLTRGKDIVAAKGGNDLIKASSTRNNHGEDIICGGTGSDEIAGNNEDNTIIGGPGKDKLNGGPRQDLLVGDNADPRGHETGPTGRDTLGGAGGNDFMVGDNYARGNASGASPDRRLHGARGRDTVVGENYSETGDASGGAADHLEGASGDDRVIGDNFAKRGRAGGTGNNDEVNTGPGADLGVGDNLTISGTAVGSGNDDLHAADGGDAGARCVAGECNDEYYGDNFAGVCGREMTTCSRVAGGGDDLLNSDQGSDFLNGGPPNNSNARPRQDLCAGGDGPDTGTQCEFYKGVERKIRR